MNSSIHIHTHTYICIRILYFIFSDAFDTISLVIVLFFVFKAFCMNMANVSRSVYELYTHIDMNVLIKTYSDMMSLKLK